MTEDYNSIEIWKPVVKYATHYEVSNLGRVRRINPTHTNKNPNGILNPRFHGAGYPMITICINNKRTSCLIHRLVAEAFLGTPTKDRYFCNHKNGIKTDNRVENLEYCSNLENIEHAKVSGFTPSGDRHYASKLSTYDVNFIKELLNKGIPNKLLALAFNVCRPLISSIKTGKKRIKG